MTKIFTTLFALMFMTQLVIGQSREREDLNTIAESKLSLGFKIGPSFALGDFGEFDINNDLSLKIQPNYQPQFRQAGLSLQLHFKNHSSK